MEDRFDERNWDPWQRTQRDYGYGLAEQSGWTQGYRYPYYRSQYGPYYPGQRVPYFGSPYSYPYFGSGFGPYAGRGPRGYRRSDERICEDVIERLTSDPYIDATNIDVAAKDSEVILKGSVEDRNQKRWAEEVAESVFGVKDVQNQLRIEQQQWGQFQQSGIRGTTESREGELIGAGQKEK